MRFTAKVFIAIFAVTASMLAATGYGVLSFVNARTEREYVEQYENFSRRLGDTLAQIDFITELLMKNAAFVLREREKEGGLPSTEALKALRDELHMFNLYVTDRRGRYIRSTWTYPIAQERPLFTYCEGYRALIEGGSTLERTPILRAPDLSWPFKFLMIPNHDRSRVLEVSVAMSFVGDALNNAMRPDKSVRSIGLFTPNGNVIGSVRSDAGEGSRPFDPSSASFDRPQSTPTGWVFYSKVPTTTADCCECRTKGLTLPDGKYYYILRTEVSRAPLDGQLAGIRRRFFLISLVALFASVLTAYLISRRLVEKLAMMGERVNRIARSNDLSQRLGLRGTDEVGILAERFDAMLERLQANQAELAEAGKRKALVELSHQVAHDIRSPLAALEAVARNMAELPEEQKGLIRASIGRIRDIAVSLLDRHRRAPAIGACPLAPMIAALAAEKRLVLRPGLQLTTALPPGAESGPRAAVEPAEFSRVLSNLVDNAAEAYGGGPGVVRLALTARGPEAVVSVHDDGPGIPPKVLARFGERGVTHGKPDGSGLGLHHAKKTVESWGGRLEVETAEGRGTTVSVLLPAVPEPDAPTAVDAVLIDDDALTRATWAMAAKRAGCALRTFSDSARFMAAADEFDRSTPIYIDADLGDGKDGLDASREIHALGFREIRLATGHPASSFPTGLTHLRGIVGKDPPWT